MKRFIESPATVTITSKDGETFSYISNDVTYGPSEDTTAAEQVVVAASGEERFFPISEWSFESDREMRGVIADTDGGTIVIRGMNPHDVKSSVSFPSDIAYPLPRKVASAFVSSYFPAGSYGVVPLLQALVDDRGYVITLLVMSDAGAFVRYDRQWIELKDLDAIDNLGVVDVQDTAVAMYDQYDPIGKSLYIGELPISNESDADLIGPPPSAAPSLYTEPVRTEQISEADGLPAPPAASPETPSEADGLMVEAGTPVVDDIPIPGANDIADAALTSGAKLVTISTSEQLQKAVPLAVENEALRWYIEKRAAALNLQVDFPWKESE